MALHTGFPTRAAQENAAAVESRRLKHWHADVFVFENGDETSSRVMIETDSGVVQHDAKARRDPRDRPSDAIGDELAVGRALIAVGRKLIGMTDHDIEAARGGASHVHE